ncbi:carbohydrate-binding protein [Sphingobium sp. BS19]|uniref:carbohydrate-binding protein n=1 Tax=Sphingobium sp. BS19 TaxID=3018973 RepID=UPI0022EF4A69|nr:carbohydrate-binding protein [Sphingobium sp. BS19]GLI99112.1 hypothetical protein Sbs19_29300 [Sphingobium sp. BS19]
MKIIRTVLPIALTIGGFIIAGPAGAALGSALGTLGSSLLAKKPKAPSTSPATADRLNANLDPKTPRKFVLGTTALATDIRDQEYQDGQEFLHRFLVVASHKVQSIDEIWFDDKLAWSDAGGFTADYLGYLGVECYVEGNASNAKNIGPRMGTSRRFTGLAWVYLRYKLTGNSKKAESPFAQSIPTRVTIKGKGAFVYDPRLDSTVPGGSGSCRADNQATWIWSDSASNNPALQMLWYLLGWRINGKLAVGKGISAKRIDMQSFITAANLCDESVTLAAGGTQPRYRTAGIFSESDATSTVLDQFKASMNATLDDVDGKLRLTVLHNDLGSPIADFTEDDILGAFTWDQTAALDETFNVVRGTFIDPSNTSLFQAVDYPEVRIDSPDGIERVETVDFGLVQNAPQAQRLAKQRIARMQYSGMFSASFSHRAWKVQKGDVVRLSFSPLGFTNKLFRVVDTDVQVDGTARMTLREENANIYLWDADERPAIAPVAPTTYDPYLDPVYQDIDANRTNPRGEWVAGETYEVGDLVTYGGSAYRSLEAHISVSGSPPPNAFFILYAEGGAPGSDGAPGAPGADGVTTYTWIAYADSADGTVNFITSSPGGRAYIGIAANKTTSTESTNPADYQWSAYRGPANFGLVNFNSNSIVGPNFAQKIAGSASPAWGEASVYSSENFRGAAQTSFTFVTGQEAMAGLNTDPTTTASYTDIDFAYHYDPSAGVINVFENGSFIQTVGAYVAGTICQVVYDGKDVRYLYGASLARIVGASPDLRLYFDSAIALIGGRIENITFAAAGKAGDDGSNGTDGDPGATGDTVIAIYRRQGSAPATPTGNLTPSGWSTSKPAEDGTPLWRSDGRILSADGVTLIGAWSAPSIFEAQAINLAATTIVIDSQNDTFGPIIRALDPSQAIAVTARIRVALSVGPRTQSITTEFRLVGAGSWTTLASNSETDASFVAVGAVGTITNSTGVSQTYEIRATTVMSSPNGDVQLERSYFRA